MAARYTELEWMTINKDFESKGVKLISKFTFANQKHKFICLDKSCGLEFEASFCSVKSDKSGCVPCRKKSRGKDKKSLSETTIVIRIDELKFRNIELLDEYVNNHTRYNWRCLKCDHRWVSDFKNVYNRGTGCPRCIGKTVSNQDIQDRLVILKNKNIEMLDEYVSSLKAYRFRCLAIDCDHIWTARMIDVIKTKAGCAQCSGLFISEDELQRRVEKVLKRNIQLIGELTTMGHKYDFKCLIVDCGFIWTTSFKSVYINQTGCPRCKGRCKTDEEKLKILTIRKLRTRMSDQYYRGYIPTKIDKSNMSNQLKTYWFEQCKSISNKPGNGYDLDHIIPMDKFDPNDLDSMKLCWDYRNFQWIPSKENSSKSNKIMPKYFNEWHYETCRKLGIEIPV